MNVGRFAESSLGFAFRPVRQDRLNLLGKYTFLFDLTKRWGIGGKYAMREGEMRLDRDAGDWFIKMIGKM